MDLDLNVKCETIKLPEENLYGFWFEDAFNLTPKA